MSTYFVGEKDYFSGVGRIPFAGKDLGNPLVLQVYDANKLIGGKSMVERMRFATCYWHTFGSVGSDPRNSSAAARKLTKTCSTSIC